MRIKYEHKKHCLLDVFRNTPYFHMFVDNQFWVNRKDNQPLSDQDYEDIQLLIDSHDPLPGIRHSAKIKIKNELQRAYEEALKSPEFQYLADFEVRTSLEHMELVNKLISIRNSLFYKIDSSEDCREINSFSVIVHEDM